MKNIILLLTLLFAISCQQVNKVNKDSIEVVSVEEFEKGMNADEVQLLDVRTAEEFAEGHIGDAQNIDVLQTEDFMAKVENLDKSKPVYLYCRSGKRSQKAAQILTEKGFKSVTDLEGGYMAWEAEH